MSWYRPHGSLSTEEWAVALSPEEAGWDYSGLHVLDMSPGQAETMLFAKDEIVLIPLLGSFEVDSDLLSGSLRGRRDLFFEVTDRAYLPPGTELTVTSEDGGELAICSARASKGGEARFIGSQETISEVRGAGPASRQINELWSAEMAGPERIIVVEVITPGGNWSSYPPHKHDEWGDGEVPLEEIYYFRIAKETGFGFHRTYTGDGEVDESVSIRDGDVFLVPRGYHGPCVAAPGYDMYYLNVMAGPERAWAFTTDPAHRSVTEKLQSMPADARLPRR